MDYGDPFAISRELRTAPQYEGNSRSGRRDRPRLDRTPIKDRLPPASTASSEVAQAWVDLAEKAGYRLPFNVNFLAHRISERVVKDPRLRQMLLDGREDEVRRLVLKMVDRFWAEYVEAADTAANVANVFLDLVWGDLRDYSRDCLRAAYLLEHGKPRERGDEDAPHYETELEKDLAALRMRAWLSTNEEAEPSQEHRELDPSRGEVLRSAREKRSKL